MHDDLQRRGRRRLVVSAAAGVALLSASFALLVFPLVFASVLVLGALFEGSGVALAVTLAIAIGATVATVTTAVAWHHAERDALRSAQLQLATVPGAAIDVVPSWRVKDEPLARLRTTLD